MARVFVTGGTGFIGQEVVRLLVAGGHEVRVLTRRDEAAPAIRRTGAWPVVGDLRRVDDWGRAVWDCQHLVHLAQPPALGGRISARRARSWRAWRPIMDANLLNRVRKRRLESAVYVAGTSFYGDLGPEPATERARPSPRGWGPYVAPALQALQTSGRDLPLVYAFPGYVYGPASWFREAILLPLQFGLPLPRIRGPEGIWSPVHRLDCARALVHLLEHGTPGRRYFVVDDEPTSFEQMVRLAGRALDRSPRWQALSPRTARALLGPVVTESLMSRAHLLNHRLRATGFTLKWPTVKTGIPQVVQQAPPPEEALARSLRTSWQRRFRRWKRGLE